MSAAEPAPAAAQAVEPVRATVGRAHDRKAWAPAGAARAGPRDDTGRAQAVGFPEAAWGGSAAAEREIPAVVVQVLVAAEAEPGVLASATGPGWAEAGPPCAAAARRGRWTPPEQLAWSP